MRYAISDIHGCYKTFRTLVEERIHLSTEDRLYLLGDYIDRGPSARKVIDYIIEIKKNGYHVDALRGNHEQIMLDVLSGRENMNFWLLNGAETTIQSFGLRKQVLHGKITIQDKYLSFINQLLFYIELKDYWLVHAGFNFTGSDPFRDTSAMLWLREMIADEKKLKGKRIVRGHTPLQLDEIKRSINQPNNLVITIDGGCVYKNRFGLGKLVAFNLDTDEVVSQDNID
jgi:serine/threonine protein phosphatase 1